MSIDWDYEEKLNRAREEDLKKRQLRNSTGNGAAGSSSDHEGALGREGAFGREGNGFHGGNERAVANFPDESLNANEIAQPSRRKRPTTLLPL